METADPC